MRFGFLACQVLQPGVLNFVLGSGSGSRSRNVPIR